MRMSRSGEMADRPAERTPFGWAALGGCLAVTGRPRLRSLTTGAAAPPRRRRDRAERHQRQRCCSKPTNSSTTTRRTPSPRKAMCRSATRAARCVPISLVYNLDTGAIHAIGDVEIVHRRRLGHLRRRNRSRRSHECRRRDANCARASATAARWRRARRCATAKARANFATSSTQAARSAKRRPSADLEPARAARDPRPRHAHHFLSRRGARSRRRAGALSAVFRASRSKRGARVRLAARPNIGRNRRLGAFYEQPYYWAISPSQDLTASLRLHGNVNPLIGLEYRKRFWSGQLEFDTTITQEQLFDTDGDRFGEELFPLQRFRQGRFHINNYWNWGFGARAHLRRLISAPLRSRTVAGERRGPYIGTRTRASSRNSTRSARTSDSYSQIAFVELPGSARNRHVGPAARSSCRSLKPITSTRTPGSRPMQLAGQHCAFSFATTTRLDTFEGNDGAPHRLR